MKHGNAMTQEARKRLQIEPDSEKKFRALCLCFTDMWPLSLILRVVSLWYAIKQIGAGTTAFLPTSMINLDLTILW